MIFIENKYTKIYFNIIYKASQSFRVKSEKIYFENHHITPISIGGSNGKSNLILLTSREHFICHHLLTKMTVGSHRRSMLYAFQMMCSINLNHKRYRNKSISRIYAKLKEEIATIRKGKTYEEIFGDKKAAEIRKKQQGPKTPIHRKNMSLTRKGCIPYNKGKSTILKGKTYEEIYGVDKAIKLKEIRRIARLGRTDSALTRKRQSLVRKGKRKLGENSNACPVIINNSHYSCKKEACTDLNISLYKLNKVIRGWI